MRPGLAIALRAAGASAFVVLLAAAAWLAWDTLAGRPIAKVVFTGQSATVPAAALERLAAGLRGRPGREVALPELREAVKRLPWVRECAVRRRFPDTLEIAIEAFTPLARWDDTRLVSIGGEVFAAEYAGELPRFTGPEGTAGEMALMWTVVRRSAAELGSPVTELALSERRAWQATLATGLVLDLGRGEVEARLARFARAWPLVAAEARTATRADLRYPNGFSLRGLPAPEKKPAAKSRRA